MKIRINAGPNSDFPNTNSLGERAGIPHQAVEAYRLLSATRVFAASDHTAKLGTGFVLRGPRHPNRRDHRAGRHRAA